MKIEIAFQDAFEARPLAETGERRGENQIVIECSVNQCEMDIDMPPALGRARQVPSRVLQWAPEEQNRDKKTGTRKPGQKSTLYDGTPIPSLKSDGIGVPLYEVVNTPD